MIKNCQSLILRLLPIIALSLLLSCSFFAKRSESTHAGVPLENVGAKKLPEIRESITPDFKGVGPEPDQLKVFQNQAITTKVPVVALILGPGLNRAAGYIGLLRAFQRHDIPIRLISGSGMGAVVAALYANGMTSQMIEWNFYKFFNASKGLKPYTDEWLEVAKRSLLIHFKDKKIQNSSLSLILPIHDGKKRVVHYLSRGNLYSTLLANLRLHRGGNSHTYSAPFEWEVYNREQLEKFGADILIGADVLGNDIDFISADDFLIGVFGRVVGRSKRERESMDSFFELPVGDMPLDSQEDLPGLLQRCLVAGESVAKQLKVEIADWQSNPKSKAPRSDQDWKAPEMDAEEDEKEEL